MSLIAWFPLNGNTNNQGSGNYSISNTPSFTNSGKVTNSCGTNSSIASGTTYLTQQTLSLTNTSPISIFTWVYVNNYSSSGANLNGLVSNHNHGHNNDCGSGFGLTLRNHGSSFSVSLSTSHSSGRTYSSYYGHETFTAASWHHVGFVYTGHSIKLFLDGKQQKIQGYSDNNQYEMPFVSSYSSNNPIGVFSWSTGYASYSTNCQLNDVRVYDHALSKKEVRQLSKGLCLHYSFNFEDLYTPVEYIQSTGTQYINTGYVASNTTKIDINTMWLSNSGSYQSIFGASRPSNVWGGFGFVGPYVEYNTNDTNVQALTANTLTNIVLDNNKFYIDGTLTYTFTSGTFNTLTTYLLGYNSNGNLQTTRCRVYSCKIFDNGVLVRDFIPAVRNIDGKPGLFDRVDNVFYTNSGSEEFSYPPITTTNTIQDCSGYKNTGTFSNSIVTTNDTPIGNISGYLNDVWCLNETAPKDMYAMSIFMWIKQPVPNTQRFLFGTFDSFTNNGIGWWVDSGSSGLSNLVKVAEASTYSVGTAMQDACDGNWHLIGITFDGSNYKTYKDGDLLGTVTTPTGYIYNPVYIFGGAYYENEKMAGYLADVKLFATALSADDVQQLYQARAAIDKTGNLYTNCIEELYTNIKLPTKTGIIKSTNITESSGNTKLFGGYTELEYIQSSGTQYIDTNVIFNTAATYPIDIYFKATPANSSGINMPIAGNLDSGWNAPVMLNFCQNKMEWGTGGYTAVGSYTPEQTYDFYFHSENNYQYGKINDTTLTLTSRAQVLSDKHFAIGCMNGCYYKGKIYNFKVYSGNKLVRNYIPVKRNKDNTIGLYDKVENKFYTNAGSGTFTAGKELGIFSSIKTNQIYEGE